MGMSDTHSVHPFIQIDIFDSKKPLWLQLKQKLTSPGRVSSSLVERSRRENETIHLLAFVGFGNAVYAFILFTLNKWHLQMVLF